MKHLDILVVQDIPKKLVMKEKKCESCGNVYKMVSYAEELKPNNLCSACTVKYLYERYHTNGNSRQEISIAPYYGIEVGKFRRAIQTYPKKLVTA